MLEHPERPFSIIDVIEFQHKFTDHSAIKCKPELTDVSINKARLAHLYEEVGELGKALKNGDIAEVADALADIIYVAMGSFIVNGLPYDDIMFEVHRANMDKIPMSTNRAKYDAVKPLGWVPPNLKAIIER